MDIIVKYIDELLEKSTPDAPMWNIEKIRQGLKSNWNYIDGVMIKAVLQMYDVTKDEKYLKFADDFIDYRVHEDGTIEGYSIGRISPSFQISLVLCQQIRIKLVKQDILAIYKTVKTSECSCISL